MEESNRLRTVLAEPNMMDSLGRKGRLETCLYPVFTQTPDKNGFGMFLLTYMYMLIFLIKNALSILHSPSLCRLKSSIYVG